VVGQVEECAHAITQLVGALQERLEVFRRRGIQSLEELERQGVRLPRIVVAIDEVTSLAFREIQRVAPEEASMPYAALDGLSTLARLGRTAGIHLLVATQRPDPEVLPGQLLANVGASIAFGVRNFRDSETILREGDASAAFLPRVAGRGVYVFGMEREEFQTPYLSGEEARQRLEERWPELQASAVALEESR
jgi:DNA segregation ATPase FtsK/SpoIIIE-like protein